MRVKAGQENPKGWKQRVAGWWLGLPFVWRVILQTGFELGVPAAVAAVAWKWWSAPGTSYWSVLVAVGWALAAFLRIWHKQSQNREFGSVQAKLERTLEDIAGYATGGKTRPVLQVAGPPTGEVVFAIFNPGQYPLRNLTVSVWRMEKTGRKSGIGHPVVENATDRKSVV